MGQTWIGWFKRKRQSRCRNKFVDSKKEQTTYTCN